MKEVIEFYNKYDEDNRLKSKTHLPEYLITMKYIKKYLTPNSKILEIGAGTGRYSIALADMGYDITSVELVPHNIEILKSKIKTEHKIKVFEGNACDLSFIEDNTYDIVLLLGPMYHLFNDIDKHKALSEAIRVVKILDYIDKGLIDDNFHAYSSPNGIFELYRKSDIDKLMENYDVTRLHFVGVDMLSYLYSNKLNLLNKKEFEEYMKFLSVICEREDLVGFSQHMLDVFKKN